MRSANLSAPLKGFRPYNALIGLNQASGLAGGPDCSAFGIVPFKINTVILVGVVLYV